MDNIINQPWISNWLGFLFTTVVTSFVVLWIWFLCEIVVPVINWKTFAQLYPSTIIVKDEEKEEGEIV